MNEALFPRREEWGGLRSGAISGEFHASPGELGLQSEGEGTRAWWRQGPSLSPGEEVALLWLLAGLCWPPELPPLTASSFVLQFRVFSSRAWCQTPSRTPSPAGQYWLGRWRWQPRAAPEGQGEEPREGDAFGLNGRSHTGPWGYSVPSLAASGAPMSWHLPGSSLLYHTCHASRQNRRALRATICACSIYCCTPGTKDSVWHTVGAH